MNGVIIAEVVKQRVTRASQPTDELHDSQGGVFEPPPTTQNPSTCGVVPKAWQKKQKNPSRSIMFLLGGLYYRGEKTESGNGCSYYTIFHLRPLLTRGLSMQWRIGHYIRIDRIEIIERLNIMDARSLGLIDLMGSDRTENRNIEGFGHNAGRRGIVDFGPLIWVRNKEYCSEAAAETQTELAVNSRNPTSSA
ncbi:hypothetical protein ACET3Z_013845 [Daucus carota]